MKTDSATHRGSPPPPGDAELPAPGAQLGSPQTWKRTRGPRCPFLFGERHGVGGWRGHPPQFSRRAGAAGTAGSEEQPQNQVQNRARRAVPRRQKPTFSCTAAASPSLEAFRLQVYPEQRGTNGHTAPPPTRPPVCPPTGVSTPCQGLPSAGHQVAKRSDAYPRGASSPRGTARST